jgi:hypothetical protein
MSTEVVGTRATRRAAEAPRLSRLEVGALLAGLLLTAAFALQLSTSTEHEGEVPRAIVAR